MKLDFKTFETMTFDCYGTIIDWETGILRTIDGDRKLANKFREAATEAAVLAFKNKSEKKS